MQPVKYHLVDEEPNPAYVCRHCAAGHRREGKQHVTSQRAGETQTTPCSTVVAVNIGEGYETPTGGKKLPWIVYVNGQRLRAGRRIARFATGTAGAIAGWRCVFEVK